MSTLKKIHHIWFINYGYYL